MNLQELDSYNLADAVKFNKQLNPRLWQKEQMRPEVRDKLLEIAADFKEFLGLSDLEVKDITVSGSNAGYTYTPYSDIDLHLVVDIPKADSDDVYRELFDAKKYQYNDLHNIKIGGYDVELYVENANKPPVSQGVFSVLNNDWINIPRYRKSTVDDDAVRSKYEDFKHRIDDAVKSNDMERIDSLARKIKTYRQAGLDAHGELGPENLAYKMLRTQGYITKLYDAKAAARDAELSLAEQNKVKVKKPFVYGHKSVAEDVTATPDGVGASTRMFLSEKPTPTQEEIIRDFLNFAVEELEINNVPKLRLKKDPEWSIRNKSFGRYDAATGELIVALGNRHIMDVLRTLAHELTHRKQDETESMPPDAGETGSAYENEANARAGVLMRDYAGMHPEYFEDVAVNEASGYIPTRAQAKDPRFNMALTVDVHPGQTGKEANKMALKTDKQGKPELLIKSANLLKEFQEFKEGLLEDRDLFEVKMTGKNLAKLASDIKGVKVGLEFEMIVPNVSEDDDSDREPDYEYDERVRDIDDAISFFDDGDHNYGSVIRRTREAMESDFLAWQVEQMDEAWDRDGFEFFREYLDREEPFDEEDYLEQARDIVVDRYPEITVGTDEYDDAIREALNEINATYYTDTWEAQGRSYDRAREEFDDEQRDNFSEQDWLSEQGMRYASDVINEYTDLTWPHWTTSGGDAENDIKGVALDFMNAMGMSSVAIATSYHGNYEKWNGSEWVRIGSNKPDDCFTIEPDGSLEADDTGESGLEFVSPPVPLEDVGTVMKKVQNWAGTYGAYTGLGNKTSMHTNISVPGYDLKNLDYVKAALLLGDEHVLREFERFGNSYAKPAIEKVRQLVKDKPEKARELLDKMQNQLNAEASKLIHSGVTDKFTSINTKDNRIEFRSPGGDYLTDIAENPKKLQDTINRMVVAMDAAMDPNKYKQEYQKKLYKLLSGQQFGREGKSGAKQEMKKDDKDLLNIFSRYAAGELPKQALKSFVRQAQLQRKLAKGEETGKMWWNVKYAGQRMEVVADNKGDAKVAAVKEWGLTPAQAQLISAADITPLRPYEEPPTQQDSGTYRITTTGGGLIAGDEYGNDQTALQRAQYWAQRRGVDVVVRNPQGDEIGRVDSSGNITSEPQGVDTRVDYEIYNRESNNAIRTFQARNDDEAMRALDDHRALMPASAAQRVGIRRAGTGQGATTAQSSEYELYRISDGRAVTAPAGNPIVFRADSPEDAESKIARYATDFNLGAPELFAVRSVLNVPQQQTAVNTPPAGGTGEGLRGNWGFWLTNADRFARWGGTEDLRRFSSREAAEEWLASAREQNPRMRLDIEVREIEPTQQAGTADVAQGGIVDVAGEQQPNWEIRDASTNGLVDQFYAPDQNTAIGIQFDYLQDQGLDSNDYVLQAIEAPAQAPRTLTRPGQGQQVFTGEWQVVDSQGRELYRFGGVGNSQADANRVAAQWAQRNMVRDEVNVVPVMGAA